MIENRRVDITNAGMARAIRELTGIAIPVAGRIVAVVDAFDAITSNRPYRAARSVHVAMQVLREQYNKHYEGRLVEALESIISAELPLYDESGVAASLS